MREKSDHPEFMKTVMEIKSAEEKRSKMISDSHAEADKIARQAREDILEARRRNEETIVAMKNSMLQEGAGAIEEETQALLKKTKAEAAKTAKMGLEAKDAQKLAAGFLQSL